MSEQYAVANMGSTLARYLTNSNSPHSLSLVSKAKFYKHNYACVYGWMGLEVALLT